jgi:osmotically-inducible protein OsmY
MRSENVLLESSSDDTLRKRLFERIYKNPTFAAFADSENPPVHIIVEGGGVILTGVVDRQIDASVAETIARNTFGVRNVENRLRVATSIPSP